MFVGESRCSESKYENEHVSRKSFDEELSRIYKGRGGTKPEWTKERITNVMSMIEEHKAVHLSKPRWLSSSHYHYAKLYDVIKKGEHKILIMKRKKETDPAVQMVPSSEYFDILSEIHNNNKHAGRDKMLTALKSLYIIPKPVLDSFLRLCKFCRCRKAPPRPNLNPIVSYKSRKVIQETETMDTNRGRIDLIDLECTPDGDYRWVLHYQENLTKFSFLRPLVLDNEIEVAMELLKILLEVGCPAVLESSNGPDYTESVISILMDMWPNCNIKNASSSYVSTDETIQSVNDIERLIQTWMQENNSINWALGIYYIQYQKNCAFHKGILKTPFKALLDRDPPVISLQPELSSKLNIPDDLDETTLTQPAKGNNPNNVTNKKSKSNTLQGATKNITDENTANKSNKNQKNNDILKELTGLTDLTGKNQPAIYGPLEEDNENLIETAFSSDMLILNDSGELTDIGQSLNSNSNNIIHTNEQSNAHVSNADCNEIKPNEKDDLKLQGEGQKNYDKVELLAVVKSKQPSKPFSTLEVNQTKLMASALPSDLLLLENLEELDLGIEQSAKQSNSPLDSTNSVNLIGPRLSSDSFIPGNLEELTILNIRKPDDLPIETIVFNEKNKSQFHEQTVKITCKGVNQRKKINGDSVKQSKIGESKNIHNSNSRSVIDKTTDQKPAIKIKRKQKKICELESQKQTKSETFVENTVVENEQHLKHSNTSNKKPAITTKTYNLPLPDHLKKMPSSNCSNNDNKKSNVVTLEKAAKNKQQGKNKYESKRKQKTTMNFTKPMMVKQPTELNHPINVIHNNIDVGTNKEICEKATNDMLKSQIKSNIKYSEEGEQIVKNNNDIIDNNLNKKKLKQSGKSSPKHKNKSQNERIQKVVDHFAKTKKVASEQPNYPNYNNIDINKESNVVVHKTVSKNKRKLNNNSESQTLQKKYEKFEDSNILDIGQHAKVNNFYTISSEKIYKEGNEKIHKEKNRQKIKIKSEGDIKLIKAHEPKDTIVFGIEPLTKHNNPNSVNYNKIDKGSNEKLSRPAENKLHFKYKSEIYRKHNSSVQITEPIHLNSLNSNSQEPELCKYSSKKERLNQDFNESRIVTIKYPTDVINFNCLDNNIEKDTIKDKNKQHTNPQSKSKNNETKGMHKKTDDKGVPIMKTVNVTNFKSISNIGRGPKEHIIEQGSESKRKRKSESKSESQSKKVKPLKITLKN